MFGTTKLMRKVKKERKYNMENKGIKKISIEEKTSQKGTIYSVIEVELSNGKTFNLFLDSVTKDVVDLFGKDSVVLEYVEKTNKDGKIYHAIELRIEEEGYIKLFFMDKGYELMIKKLNEQKASK